MLYAETLTIAQRAAKTGALTEALATLRELPLDDFGMLLLEPGDLAPLLPSMPTAEIQARWNGRSGEKLLAQSLSFMRVLESLYARLRQRPLFDRTFLDYGCGWGRLLRVALYYSNPEKLYGADAWDQSLSFCRECGVPGTLIKIDAAPEALPIPVKIDVAYAFSIFTHLPEHVVRAALHAMRGVVAADGLLVFTVRPIEYWRDFHPEFTPETRAQLLDDHDRRGFAFWAGVDSRYGHASMSHAFVDRLLEATGWRRLAFDRLISDPMQEIVAAEPI